MNYGRDKFDFDLPEQYDWSMKHFRYGLDTEPDFLELSMRGMEDKYDKICCLGAISSIRFMLEEEGEELTEEEQEMAREKLNEWIEQYNNL